MAGNGTRDVQLTISAKNEATKAVDAVAAALKALTDIQDGLGASASKADGLLGELTKELQSLSAQARGLEALGTVAGAIDKASGAVERLQTTADAAKGAADDLATRYAKAGESTQILATAANETKSALDGEKKALADLREEQLALNASVRAAESAYAASRAALLKAKTPTEELRQAYRDQLAALQGLYTLQGRNAAAQEEQRGTIDRTKKSLADATSQLEIATDNEVKLSKALERSTAAAERQQTALEAGKAELAAIQELAAPVAAALGGVALSQDAIAEASARAAADLARVNAALASQPTTGAQTTSTLGPAAQATANYRAQVVAVAEARAAMDQAREAATRLGQAVAKADEPTAQLTRDFVLAKAAAATAEQAFDAQTEALNRLKVAARAAFADANAARELVQQTAVTNNLRTALISLVAAFPALLAREEELAAKNRTLGETFRALLGALTTIPQAANEAEGAVGRLSERGHGAIDIFARMRNELIGLTTAYVGFYGAINAVEGVLKTYQTLQSAQQRLGVAFEGDQQKVAENISFVRQESERLGVSFNTLVQEYTRVAIAGKEAGYSAEGTRKIFVAFAEASRVAGLTQQQLESAFLGLRESIERGTINARNFNLEIGQNVPGAVQAMAAALGVSVAKFTELQKASGGVAATEDTLVKFADNLGARFKGELPNAIQTLNAELGRFQSHLQEAQLAVADGGFAGGLTVALRGLDDEFKNGGGDSFFRQIGATLGSLAGVIPLVVNNFGLFVDVAKVFIGLKIAEVILGIARSGELFGVSLVAAGARVDGLTAALARMGAEDGILTVAMTRLRAAIASTGEALNGMTVATALLTVRQAAATVGTGLLSASLGVMRGVMIGLTATAEAMWIAIGGFPGIIITGLTFVITGLLGDWIGGIGKANDAMATHESIMEKVREAYSAAAGDAQKFKDGLKDLSTIQIEVNNQALRSELGKARGAANIGGGGDEVFGAGVRGDTIAKLDAATRAFRAGQVSALAYKATINGLAEADPRLDKTLVAQLQDVADKAAVAEKGLNEGAATLRVLRGAATDADRTLLGLSQTAEKVSGSFDASALDRYTKALNDLQKQIPGLSKLADLRAKLSKVDDDYQAGKLALAGPLSSKDPGVAGKAQADLAALNSLRDTAVAEIKFVSERESARETNGQPILDKAREFVGDGRGDKGLSAFFKAQGADIDPKFAAYCAAFVNAVLKSEGHPGTGSDEAKSFLTYGQEVTTQDARPGDIVVIKNPDGTYHTGIFAGAAGNGRAEVVGGNQGRTRGVSEESFPASQIASIRRAPSPVEVAREQNKNETAQVDFNKFVAALAASLKAAGAAAELSPRDAFIQSKLAEIQKRVDESGPTPSDPGRQKLTFSADQRAAVTSAAGSEFDANKEIEERKKVASSQLELNKLLKGGVDELTREQYIHDEAIKDGVNLLDDQGKKYAEIKGKIYDLEQQQRAYTNVVALGSQLKTAQSELKDAYSRGDGQSIEAARQSISRLVAEIKAALPAAEAFAKTLGDQRMVENLRKVADTVGHVKDGLVTASQINQQLATGFVGAFDKSFQAVAKFASGIGTAKDLLHGLRDAFLGFAADFLKSIAEMILKQTILNLLAKTPIGSLISSGINKAVALSEATSEVTSAAVVAGANAFASTAAIPIIGPELAPAAGAAAETTVTATYLPQLLAAVHHTGGIAGQGGATRPVSPAMYFNAARLHTGGIPGLKPNEIPAILEKQEEVLTRSDPRHAFNLGGQAAPASAQPQSLKIINLSHAGQALSEAMKTDVGEKAILNHVRNNRGAWKAAIG